MINDKIWKYQNVNIARILFWLLFAIVAGCFAFCFLADPLSGDDLMFLSVINELSPRGIYSDSASFISGMIADIRLVYNCDVSRLTNFIAIIFLGLPAWIASAVVSICFALAIWIMTRLATIRTSDFLILSVMLFFVVFGIMWADNMFCIMYSFNYVVSTFLMLIAVRLFLRKKKTRAWIAIFTGLLAGASHESFAIALMAGFTATLIFHKEMIRPDRIAMLMSVAVGSLLFFTAPSLGVRLEHIVTPYIAPVQLLYAWPYLLLVCLSLLCLSRAKWRRLPLQPVILVALASGCLLLFITVTNRYRAFLPTDVLACIAVPKLLRDMFPALSNHGRWQTCAATTIAAIIVVHLWALCGAAAAFREDMVDIQRKLDIDSRTENCHTVFAAIPAHESPLSLGRPVKNPNATIGSLNYYFNGKIRIIPEALRDYNPSLGKTIDPELDIRTVGGHLVTKSVISGDMANAYISYGNYSEPSWVHVMPFISSDGYIYHYLRPVKSSISEYLGTPTAIRVFR